MPESIAPSPAPKKRRRWLRALAWLAGVFIVLLVGVYFVATSSAFFKGAILPRVSAALHAQITVSQASLSPFKEVILHDLKVQTTGSEPLVMAPEVRLRYSLLDIVGGKINVEEIALSSPTVVLAENPDGSNNLDPILKGQEPKPKAAEAKPKQPGKPSKALEIDLKKFALTDATIRKIKNYPGGNRDVTEVSHVNVGLSGVKNGQTGKLDLSADISVENHPPSAASGVLQAKLNGSFAFSLTADAKPGAIKGATRLAVTRAEGALAGLAALGSDLTCDITPTDIKEVALRFQKGNASLGELRVSGPFDAEKTEGRLTVEILSIDRQLLNLAGAGNGLEFGSTTINSTNQIQLEKAGLVITASGQLEAAKLQVTRTNQTTPRLDLSARYEVSVDRSANTALLRTLALAGTQNGSPLLQVNLSSPMTFAWGNANNAVGDAALNLVLTNFSLADWKPFLGDSASAGTVNASLKLLSQQGGQQLTFDLNSQIENLTAGSGSNQITQATVTLLVSGKAMGSKQFTLNQCKLDIARQNQQLLAFSASGACEPANQKADLQLAGHAALDRLAQALPQAGTSVSSGAADLNVHLMYDSQGGSAVKGELQVTNLVVSDLAHQIPATPLQARMRIDAGLRKQIADVRLCELILPPTSRATNAVQLSGQVDLSQTNAIQGNLKLTADSLDLTTAYDLFAGGNKTSGERPAPAAKPAAQSVSSAAAPETEPAARQLPFRNFTAQANIHRLYLREIEIADWQTTAKLDGSHAALNPFQLTLNGAPVNTAVDLDLGVPGYKYDLTFGAQAVPLAPLVNTFQPERKGQISGTVTAQAKVSGTGTTGASLQKTLTGQFDVSSTNLNLAVANIKSPLLKTLVNVIATLPELFKNPASTVSGLFGGSTGTSSGGMSDVLSKSPIDAIIARGKMGSGRIDLQQAVVRSSAFEADAQGTITLQPELTNSIVQIPVSVSLDRSVAQQVNLVPANTPTNAAYAKLPDFLTMKGTVGKPKADINKSALAKAAIQGITGGHSGTAPNVGGLLEGLLPGHGSPGANAGSNASTNPPATNQSPANNVLDQLFKPKR